MIKRIVVPLDGSEAAEAVLPQVRRLIKGGSAELVLVRATLPMPADGFAAVDQGSIAEADAYVTSFAKKLKDEGIRARGISRVGAAARTILDVAEDERATLVALATHGRSGVARALLGSVAEAVLRKAPVPVLAVRPFWSYEVVTSRPEERPIRNVLVPLDGSENSMAVVPRAVELAKLTGARVVLLHAPEPGGAWQSADGGTGEALRGLEIVARTFGKEGIATRTVVEPGDPASAILAQCRPNEIDLVAMATHGRTGLARLIVGSVTEKVLRSAEVPLLIVSTRPAGA